MSLKPWVRVSCLGECGVDDRSVCVGPPAGLLSSSAGGPARTGCCSSGRRNHGSTCAHRRIGVADRADPFGQLDVDKSELVANVDQTAIRR